MQGGVIHLLQCVTEWESGSHSPRKFYDFRQDNALHCFCFRACSLIAVLGSSASCFLVVVGRNMDYCENVYPCPRMCNFRIVKASLKKLQSGSLRKKLISNTNSTPSAVLPHAIGKFAKFWLNFYCCKNNMLQWALRLSEMWELIRWMLFCLNANQVSTSTSHLPTTVALKMPVKCCVSFS